MSSPLLYTKLTIPQLSDHYVVRLRLLNKLDGGSCQNNLLTLVCAPAGYGKTTLISNWLEKGEEQRARGDAINKLESALVRSAWLTLDSGDDDLARFLSYLVAAIQQCHPGIGEAMLAMLRTAKPPNSHTLATWLIDDLAEIPTPFVLVIDDYHTIHTERIHDFISFLIDHKPTQMSIVIASRADPALPLARLRAHGQLTEIRQDDLCFTHEEASTLIHNLIGLNLTLEQVDTIVKRTEGWVAGLQLAGLSMRNVSNIASFIHALSGGYEHIADFLTDEVFAQQPEDIKDFLLQTSILDRLSVPLCEAVTGQAQVASSLERLRKENLFLVPLDHHREWYRYHALFRDLLRKRLYQSRGSMIPELHRKASHWYETEGLLAPAIEHALAGKYYEKAAELIEQVGESVLMRSESLTMLRWLDALPHEMKREHPVLFVFDGLVLMLSGKPLQSADEILKQLSATGDIDSLRGEFATYQGLIATMKGEAEEAILFSEEALTHLPPERPFFQSLAADSLGMAFTLLGDPDSAVNAFRKVVEISERTGNVMMSIMALSNLAGLQLMRGQLLDASESYHRTLDIAAEKLDKQSPVGGKALLGLGMLAQEWNDLEAALAYYQEAAKMMARSVEVGLPMAHLSIASVKLNMRDWEGAQASINQAYKLSKASAATPIDDILTEESQARLWLAQEKLGLVSDWLESKGFLFDTAVEPLISKEAQTAHGILVNQGKYLLFVRLALAKKQPKTALGLLDPLYDITLSKGYMHRVIEILALKALAVMQQGEVDSAVQILDQALSLAEPQGYRRTFLDEGQPMAELLYTVAARGEHPTYAGILLAAFSKEMNDQRIRFDKKDSPEELIEPLSEREFEVLILISEGLSNREIADRLYISISTVKSHTSHIYSKLNVTKRTRAISQARSLGLLPWT